MYLLPDFTSLLMLYVFFLISYLCLKRYWRNDTLPPGPTPLPLLGNFLELGVGGLVNSMTKLTEKYGDIFTVYLGSRPVVVVTGYKLVRQIYLDNGDDYLNRGDMPIFETFYKHHGMIFTNNLYRWRTLRRFSMPVLRDLGFGKRSTEDRIQEETSQLLAELKETKESFFDPQHCFSKSVCNIIFSLMFGNHHKYEDDDIDTVLSCINEALAIMSSAWGQMYDMFPGLMRFIPGPHHKIFKLLKKLSQFVETRIKINQKTLDPNNPRDYVDVFLIQIEKEKNNPDSEFYMKNLLANSIQLFFAGVETTSTTLTYSFLVLLKYPDVLAKVHEEIDNVVGRNRSPTMQDRSNLPYTEATIHEIQRFTDLVPLGLPRKTIREVKLKGYTIPKNTDVTPALTSVLQDPSCFKYPKEFNPENFLNDKGEFQKNNAFMPLAAGKRNCLGEPLVRMELFLFLAIILQSFDLKSPVPPEEVDVTPNVSGIANLPKPYKIAFIPR
ncbi:cytochrome P450 2A4-like [Pseudophryne corroboree]|uniref:cytochrome P450 2A4-like n=1 Tax=Pseudophryne corroboree TaxID=495146 RepID=UPI003081206A